MSSGLYYRLTPKGIRYIEGNFSPEFDYEGYGSAAVALQLINELGAPNNSGAEWDHLLKDYRDYRSSNIDEEEWEDYIDGEAKDELRSLTGDLERQGLIREFRSRGSDEPMEELTWDDKHYWHPEHGWLNKPRYH